MGKIRKAVIPVAGLGTRMLPAAKSIPKEMITLVDRPLIDYIVDEAIKSGIETVILVTGRNKGSIEDYFDHAIELEESLARTHKLDLLEEIQRPAGVRVISLRQKKPLGLGHAVLCAEPLIAPGEDFAVLLGDDLILNSKSPCISQLMKKSEEHQASVIGVMPIPAVDTQKYGVVSGQKIDDRTLRMEGMVEKPEPAKAPSLLATPGRYILPHSIFNLIRDTAPGAGGEIQLTDAINKLCQREKVIAYQFEGERHDCGNKMGLWKAQIRFALERPEFSEAAKEYILSVAKGLSS